ncbi:MAG TPA: mandelate racemase/muconate lactonizing enzyme family protein [Microthrixaceae bacterium]|nr:mandelate racemase/muconate lactonizing enzyme family protein [Microthrixaceae bacterium]
MSSSAPVTTIELFEVEVPLSEIARSAMAESDTGLGMAIAAEDPWLSADFLYVRLVDEDGIAGWGECYVWVPESAVSQRGAAMVIREHIGRFVLGAKAADIQAIGARMDRNIPRNEMAKGVLDVALHDLAARQVGRPVHDLIGGAAVDRIPLCGLVPLASPDFMAEICAGYVAAGYRSLRIKLGTGPRDDLAIMTAIRDRVGWDVRIRCDYNQAYDAPTAVRSLRLLEPFDLDAAEQPLPIGDLLGMRWVQERTSVPLFLHEGFFSLSDVVSLTEAGGMGVLGINAERPGGITAALRAIDYVSARGMGTIIHNQPLGIGTAAHAHIAAARWDRLGHAPELAGDVMFSEHLVDRRYEVVDGEMLLPGGAGWGIEVDRGALDRHLVAEPTVMTL